MPYCRPFAGVLRRRHLRIPPAGATLSRTHIVFAYAGDLWSVPREGGDARRLTTGVGIEDHPVFSPDGSLIAFMGEYDGNTATGGVPKRLTWHAAGDVALGWTPDGKRILFSSSRTAYTRRLKEHFTVDLVGRVAGNGNIRSTAIGTAGSGMTAATQRPSIASSVVLCRQGAVELAIAAPDRFRF